jgi:hypothetical protein
MFIPFPEFRPDVDDFRGQHTQVMSGILPRGDGWGPFPDLQAYTAALPSACRGFFSSRKTDGSILVIAASATRLYTLNNTTLTWVPVSKVTALTSISNADPAVFTKSSHGLVAGDALVLSTNGTLPTGLSVGTVYYVIAEGLTTDEFEVSTSVGGDAVATSGAGSGTHSMTYFYTSVATTEHWQFAQFGGSVIAVQANSAPQVLTLATPTAFADLGGSPPNASFVAVVGRFVVLSGLTSTPLRVQWSGLDAITTWTPGTNFSNYFDAPDGGIVRGVAGGEFGIVLQESTARRMVYVPGATPAFQIERITEDKGLLAPYSIVRAGERVFFLSQQGFQEFSAGALTPIGKERVDRTILADINLSALKYCIGAADPSATRVYWAWKSNSASGDAFNKMIAYDYGLQRWSPVIDVSGEYLYSLVKPGLTLEGLDAISGSIDALEFTLDSVQAALSSRLAAFDTNHELGFFDGDNVEAVMETPEQGGDRRMIVRGFFPRTDAETVYGSTRYRINAQSALSQTSETLVNEIGFCPQRIDTRLARGRVRIPAGEVWTYCMGIEPEFGQTGKR